MVVGGAILSEFEIGIGLMGDVKRLVRHRT